MFRLPNKHQRLTVNGRTGSGKTVFASWFLSEANFTEMPWIIFDFKGDDLLTQIRRAKPLGVEEKLPKEPGLYYVHPHPGEMDEVERMLWRIWKRGKTGIFVDEGYMIPNRMHRDRAFKAILAQGRALEIPAYTLSQRPSGVERSVFTEADFYASFDLNDKRDRQTVASFTPDNDVWKPLLEPNKKLPDYHCRWYDIGKDYSCILKPVPPVENILQRIDDRLKPKKRFL